MKMGKPHAMVVPYPLQGHVLPFVELSICLLKRGFKVTFVNTDFNHKRVMDTLHYNFKDNKDHDIRLVSISDGLAPEADRNDLNNLVEAITKHIPVKLEELIKEINDGSNDNNIEKISCVLSDMGQVLEVAAKLGIKSAVLWTMNAGQMALVRNIPKLIDNGIINSDGTLIKDQMIQLSLQMPAMRASNLVWLRIGDLPTQKLAFETLLITNESYKLANFHLCNSSYEVEPAAFELIPDVLPIGPLHSSTHLEQSSVFGHFWPEDPTCLNWLNQQPPNSVIYIAFGSLAMLNETQFHEIALALELLNLPFLWVVRPGITNTATSDNYLSNITYPDGFQDKVSNIRGKIVSWAPQKKVLSHPSIACFVSHCGWNSTIEGISNGVPFICWPYYADQFLNQTYICDVWKVGLGLSLDGDGIVLRHEIKGKVEELVGNEGIRRRSSELKEIIRKSVSQCGSSTKNLDYFVEQMK